MSEQPLELWERQLRDAARSLPYPPTPDIAAAVTERIRPVPAARAWRRRSWQAAAVIAALLLALLAVPEVRARVLEVLRIGNIRIMPVDPTPTPEPPTPLPGTATPAPRPTPRPRPTPIPSVLKLSGETTLDDARQQASFPLRLPSYPPDLGPPDKVFVQDFGGPLVVLAWLEPDNSNAVQLSLHMFGPGTFADKLRPRTIRETTVNGERAVWATGRHLLRVQRDDGMEELRLVNGHVLIWQQDAVTYRLETKEPMEEAVRIAESLR